MSSICTKQNILFFSSRRRHTIYIGDWSSDVCSSDLLFVADKALDQGRGGMSRLSELTGMSRTTITKAVAELNSRKKLAVAERGQIREAGGGRKKVEDSDPG